MVMPDRKAVEPPMVRDREMERGPERERVERDRDWEKERERVDRDRARDGGGRYSDRIQPPPPPMGRSNSLLDRLGAPGHSSSANAIPVGNGGPSLFERVSVTPMKRHSELISSGGAMDVEDDLYAPVDDGSDPAIKRRRKSGGRARRSGGKRN